MKTYPHPHSDPHPELLKLLALKRYEQPPPGFFEDFSASVIAGVQADQALPEPSPWQAFWSRFELRPVWGSLGACGLVLCALSFFQVLGGDTAPAWGDNLRLGMLPALAYQEGLNRNVEDPMEATVSSVGAILPENSSGLRMAGLLQPVSYGY